MNIFLRKWEAERGRGFETIYKAFAWHDTTQIEKRIDLIPTDWSNKFHFDLTFIRLPPKSTQIKTGKRPKDKEKTKEAPR